MKKSHPIIAIGLLVLAAHAHAQTANAGNWSGTMGISTTLSTGNTQTRTFLLNGDMAKKTATSKTSVATYLNNASASGVDTANRRGILGQYDYNLSTKLYGYGRVGLEADKVKDLSRRLSLGSGLGYHVIETPDTTFDVYGGLGYSNDKYSVNQTIGGKTKDSFGRMELVVGESSSHKLSDTVRFKQKLEFFNGVTGDKAKRYEFSAGLNVNLAKNMSLNLGVMRQHNGNAALGVKPNDTQVFTGLNVGYGQ